MPNEKKDKNIFYFYRKVACVRGMSNMWKEEKGARKH